jgi:hypothetical protein
MKAMSDTLTLICQPLRDEFTSCILNGLDSDYDTLAEVVNGCDTLMPPREIYTHLLNNNRRIETSRSVFGACSVWCSSSERRRRCLAKDLAFLVDLTSI